MSHRPANLRQLLDEIDAAATGREEVSLGVVMTAIGRRSFGPVLLLIGITLVSPLSGIPGLPTVMSLLLLVVAVQLLLGKGYFRLPRWLAKRSLERARVRKAVKWLRRPARVIDRLLKPRLTLLVRNQGTYVIALLCCVIALTTPALEVLPFSASIAGLAVTCFGLSLVAQDGCLALAAFVILAGLMGGIAYGLVGV